MAPIPACPAVGTALGVVAGADDSAEAPVRAHGAAPRHAGVAIAVPRYDAALDLLETRRSLPLRSLVAPGPSAEELSRLLAIAARVPDHGRLVPWRFIVLAGDARAAAGARLDALYGQQNPDLPPAKADMWQLYLLRAPVTVVLVSRPDPTAKVPVFNQVLSAGAAGMALVTAATAMGYAAQWLLKWPGRDPQAAALLGVGAGEQVAGFIHLGSPAETVADRARPDLTDVVTYWQPE